MEDNLTVSSKATAIQSKEHILTLDARKHLSISGIDKVISVKPDTFQAKSVVGDIVVTGQNIEVVKLDLEQHTIILNGKFDNIKYLENNKTPLLKKIFKWYFLALISYMHFVL